MLREERALAYTVMAAPWMQRRAGLVLTYIATSPEREEEAREQMLVELERFTESPVEDTELRQAVSYLAGQAEVSRQSGASVAGEILECWITAGSLDDMADPAAPFRAVTAEDVQRVAEDILGGGLRLALIGPFDEPERFEKLLAP